MNEKSENRPVRNVAGSKRVVRSKNTIPDAILNNVALNSAISLLPDNYNFEIHKTVWKITSEKAKTVALQFPEGLLMYACIISDIVVRFCGAKTIILGDVTYGACCIDDFSAEKLGAEILIHYGHSCLVPVNITRIKVLYVFVEIQFDTSHLVATILKNFDATTRLFLLGTIQFANDLHGAAVILKQTFPNLAIPQAKPLSSGETLGCTSPKLENCDAYIFVADGRFHLESVMIQNPTIPAYRYDPYSKILTREGYDTTKMKEFRWNSILKARTCKKFGVILGTLGRQGNTNIFRRIKQVLEANGKQAIQFLMAEILPQKLQLIEGIDAWVQVACPRLSIDWGPSFTQPILTPYELEVVFNNSEWFDNYPMDYYSNSGGTWSNYTANKLSENK